MILVDFKSRDLYCNPHGGGFICAPAYENKLNCQCTISLSPNFTLTFIVNTTLFLISNTSDNKLIKYSVNNYDNASPLETDSYIRLSDEYHDNILANTKILGYNQL